MSPHKQRKAAAHHHQQQLQDAEAKTGVPGALLDTSYAYALDRGDGFYTRLIPADKLPPLVGIPDRQSIDGLIVLPQPRGLSPRKTNSHVPYDGQYTLKDTRHNAKGNRKESEVSDPCQPEAVSKSPQVQASDGSTSAQAALPGQKTHCSKWIFTGTCAFTQQGCKYLHEMPEDPDELKALGFRNGQQPKWYKRHKLEEEREARLRVQRSLVASSDEKGKMKEKMSGRQKTRADKRAEKWELTRKQFQDAVAANVKSQTAIPATEPGDFSDHAESSAQDDTTSDGNTSDTNSSAVDTAVDDEQDLVWWRREKDNADILPRAPGRSFPFLPSNIWGAIGSRRA